MAATGVSQKVTQRSLVHLLPVLPRGVLRRRSSLPNQMELLHLFRTELNYVVFVLTHPARVRGEAILGVKAHTVPDQHCLRGSLEIPDHGMFLEHSVLREC